MSVARFNAIAPLCLVAGSARFASIVRSHAPGHSHQSCGASRTKPRNAPAARNGRFTFYVIFPLLIMALVDGVYYLLKRPRVSFRQAMFRWWVVLIAIGVTLCGLLGQAIQSL